jgi:hypothetical protein
MSASLKVPQPHFETLLETKAESCENKTWGPVSSVTGARTGKSLPGDAGSLWILMDPYGSWNSSGICENLSESSHHQARRVVFLAEVHGLSNQV